jgi:hypothetical protein
LFLFLYTSLKILAVTQAIAAFFALSKEKITTLNLGRLFSANSLTRYYSGSAINIMLFV